MKTGYIRFTITIIVILWGTILQAQVLRGIVKDADTEEPIPSVNIFFPDLNSGFITDDNGTFEIAQYPSNTANIHISFIGYETRVLKLDLSQVQETTIYLTPSHFKLEEVVISVPGGKLQGDNIVLVDRIHIAELNTGAPSSLAEAITRIPGLDQVSTGAGIGKPVIRGLSGNRIITYAQGIRLENQQWGEEHGLGVGGVGIGSVEVIKGPSSLLYGSDALGGVLYFVDEPYAKYNHTEGQAGIQFRSNNLGLENTAGLKINNGKIKWNIFGAYSNMADYHTPYSERVLNTRFNETNMKTSLGYANSSWITNMRYAYLSNVFGIAEEDALFSFSKSRDKLLPFQEVSNHNISWENTFYTRGSKIDLTVGFTGNSRQEYEEEVDNAALDMRLNTLTYNLKWNTALNDKIDLIIGSQGMAQENSNFGEEMLIPDGNTNDIGFFTIAAYTANNLSLQGGLRWDYRKINTDEFIEDQEIIFPAYNQDYQSLNFSLGSSYTSGAFQFRANLSSGFRAPNTSELLSNGSHEGTNQFIIGNADLKSEKAAQIDFSMDVEGEHLDLYSNFFYNSIADYIFLSPTNEVIDGDPVFQYMQSDARLYGGEWGIHFHPHGIHWLHVQSDLAVVIAKDEDDNDLPLIPPASVNTQLSAEFDEENTFGIQNIFLEHIYKFDQNRVAIEESPTDAYHLVNAGVRFLLHDGNSPLVLNAGLNNIFNREYVDHLSRFKGDGYPNPGRNFFIGIQWNFDKGPR